MLYDHLSGRVSLTRRPTQIRACSVLPHTFHVMLTTVGHSPCFIVRATCYDSWERSVHVLTCLNKCSSQNCVLFSLQQHTTGLTSGFWICRYVHRDQVPRPEGGTFDRLGIPGDEAQPVRFNAFMRQLEDKNLSPVLQTVSTTTTTSTMFEHHQKGFYI